MEINLPGDGFPRPSDRDEGCNPAATHPSLPPSRLALCLQAACLPRCCSFPEKRAAAFLALSVAAARGRQSGEGGLVCCSAIWPTEHGTARMMDALPGASRRQTPGKCLCLRPACLSPSATTKIRRTRLTSSSSSHSFCFLFSIVYFFLSLPPFSIIKTAKI